MKELLDDAQRKQYGIGYFNAVNMEMVRAYISAAEEAESPIIIGTAEALLDIASFDWIVPLMIDQAKNAKVPVAIHLDHTYHFDTLMQALRAGFGSIMYDGSRETHEQNTENSKRIVDIAHAMGASVECELGSVGGLSDETGGEDITEYTNPNEAKAFIEKTGADFLAVSIGTAHGVYESTPKLDLERLGMIRETVDVPLVLHGGSGLSDEDFQGTIANGITKINVFTDIISAAADALTKNSGVSYLEGLQLAEAAMKRETLRKMTVFGSVGRA
ncbi:MAG: class II fructose-bisphosphate aldolase [Clostridiales bacterium]|nr:class II fructose-bisphosphate aldolase [Clostridiales bacterium]